MRRLPLAGLMALLMASSSLQAQDFRLGIGVFLLADQGQDFQAGFRPAASHWQVGYRHVQWRDHFTDPFTGRRLTETTEARTGPLVAYLFRPESPAPGTWAEPCIAGPSARNPW